MDFEFWPSFDAAATMAAAKALAAAEGGEEVLRLLTEAVQLHLLEGWDPANAQGIERFIAQVHRLEKGYPGGIRGYKKQAQELLTASAAGANPFEGMVPEVPDGHKLHFGDAEYKEFEEGGLGTLQDVGFVLVAGGLGERLGYSGIKVSLPTDITTGKFYLQLYIETIVACQRVASERAGRAVKLPFAIMTSGDTHDATVALLEANGHFGLDPSQLTLMCQEKVASVVDNDGHFAAGGDWEILTKPHGHGDVHYLMHTLGVAKRWRDELGVKWAVFFQDTNALVFRAVMPALGVAAAEKYDVNSIAGPRQAKREMGAIVKLRRPDGSEFTNNVEYNQLDALLRGSGYHPSGDAPGPDGLSPFVGNMNQLIFYLPTYVGVLDATKGLVPEFVNPKYADETRTRFKKPTRLECMMQDLPRLFHGHERVGFTTLTGHGVTPERLASLTASGVYDEASAAALTADVNFYTPVKNNKVEAAAKQRKGVHPSSAAAGEADLHAANCRQLLAIGATVHPPGHVTYGEGDKAITVDDWPHVVLAPEYCLTFVHLRRAFPTPEKVEICAGSTLVLEGAGRIVIESLQLRGALTIRCTEPDASITVRNAVVENGGMRFVEVGDDEKDEVRQIRGYRLEVKEHTVWESLEEGKVIDGSVSA